MHTCCHDVKYLLHPVSTAEAALDQQACNAPASHRPYRPLAWCPVPALNCCGMLACSWKVSEMLAWSWSSGYLRASKLLMLQHTSRSTVHIMHPHFWLFCHAQRHCSNVTACHGLLCTRETLHCVMYRMFSCRARSDGAQGQVLLHPWAD